MQSSVEVPNALSPSLYINCKFSLPREAKPLERTLLFLR
eukprot:Gb_26635 [translate_table: standard]